MIVLDLTPMSAWAIANPPNCTSPDAWPAGRAFSYLKNANLIKNEALDFKNAKVSRLTSEKIGKDLYRQVHLIRFLKASGEAVLVITVNEVSS